MIKYVEYKKEYKEKVIDFWLKICVEEFGFKEWEKNIRNMDNDTYKERGGNFWIAIEGDTIIGTISIQNIGNKEAIVKSMYVLKEYRNQGIASKLMEIVLKFAKQNKYKKIILDTYKKMETAIKFYEKVGFTIEKQIGDRYIYSKEIKTKTGILTFHDAHNYGAVLQAYALKKYIQTLGYDVKIINYHHKTIPDGFPREGHEVRWDKFNKFIKELTDNEEKVYTSEEELEKLDIDFWICGSDQIWNTEITRGFNKGFFLDFKTNGKKISYAVSMGIPELSTEYEEDFKNSINKLDYISVREESLKKYSEKFTKKQVNKTLDSTLLLDAKDYDNLVLDNKYGEYLLIYTLGPDERLTEIAKKIAYEKKLKIIELNDKKQENYFCEQVSDAGPEEFLTLIKNAKTIVTNSFHGTIFSIIFKKEFYTITRLNRNSRMENILDIVGMRDRLIDKIENLENIKEQDYQKAYKNLEIEKEKSKEFLKKALY